MNLSIGNVVSSKYLKGFWRVTGISSEEVVLVNITDSEIAIYLNVKASRELNLVD